MHSKSINLNKTAAFLDPGFTGEGIVDRFRVGCEAIGDGSTGVGVFKREGHRRAFRQCSGIRSFLDCNIDHWLVRMVVFMDAHWQYSLDT